MDTQIIPLVVNFIMPFPTAEENASSGSCPFSTHIALGTTGLVKLHHHVDVAAGTLPVKVTFSGGLSFVGVGLNDDGTGAMVPAASIIG